MNMNTKTEQLALATVGDPRWAAVVARDPQADGRFFYSVRTTGVYCRPSCAARPPRPENVALPRDRRRRRARRLSRLQALQARPSRRWPSTTRRWSPSCAGCIEARGDAADASTSWRGTRAEPLSPAPRLQGGHRADAEGLRGGAPRASACARELEAGGTVTEAIYDAGYNSGGRFYEEADQVLGMTPTRFRAGGADTEIRFAIGAVLARRDPRRRERARASARSCSATIRRCWRASSRTASRTPT